VEEADIASLYGAFTCFVRTWPVISYRHGEEEVKNVSS
jgi:hypothetical protein